MKKKTTLPPMRKEKIQGMVGVMPMNQEIEYTYKVFKNVKIIFENLETTHRTVWYLPEEDLIKSFSEKEYQPLRLDEKKLKHIILNELLIDIPQDEVNKMASLTGLENMRGKKFKGIGLGSNTLKPLADYIQSVMVENILYFIQNIVQDSYNTPIGTIIRKGNEIHYEVIFTYNIASNLNELGEYNILTAPSKPGPIFPAPVKEKIASQDQQEVIFSFEGIIEEARHNGINITQRTLRFYHQMGLLPPAVTKERNVKYYPQKTLAILKQIDNLKQEGMKLSDIRLKLKEDGIIV
ncbi:MAG: MerR family transcriptional regulator [Candidatus Xenobiia bacterium LiM19]